MSSSPAPPANAGPAPFTLSHYFALAYRVGPVLLAHIGVIAAFWTEYRLDHLFWMLLIAWLGAHGITVGFHRYFAHRSFKTSRPFQFFLGVLGCITLQNGPLWWVGHHRHHHIHSDEPEDPHSPHDGLWRAHAGWFLSPCMNDPSAVLVRDWQKFPELIWLDRLSHVPALLVALLCWFLDGWEGLLVCYCGSVVLGVHLTWSVNSICHWWGSRPYRTNDQSRNNFLIAFFTFGEGWHNNHHHCPRSARLGFFWWQFDGGYLAICLFECLGLIWDVHRPKARQLAPDLGHVDQHRHAEA